MYESIARVYIYIHTQGNLINKINGMKNALLMIDKTEQL